MRNDAREDATNHPTYLVAAPGGTPPSERCGRKDDTTQDPVAALTYFGVQSIFPGLLVLVSLLGLVGHSVTQSPSRTSAR